VWFILAVALLAAGRERLRSVVFWGLAVSAPLNTLWWVFVDDRAGFRIGYYAWLGAFMVLAVAAYSLAREAARRRRTTAAA
jgi:hypothetical protein